MFCFLKQEKPKWKIFEKKYILNIFIISGKKCIFLAAGGGGRVWPPTHHASAENASFIHKLLIPKYVFIMSKAKAPL